MVSPVDLLLLRQPPTACPLFHGRALPPPTHQKPSEMGSTEYLWYRPPNQMSVLSVMEVERGHRRWSLSMSDPLPGMSPEPWLHSSTIVSLILALVGFSSSELTEDMQTNTLLVNGETIPLRTSFKEGKPTIARITLKSKIVIPPNSVVLTRRTEVVLGGLWCSNGYACLRRMCSGGKNGRASSLHLTVIETFTTDYNTSKSRVVGSVGLRHCLVLLVFLMRLSIFCRVAAGSSGSAYFRIMSSTISLEGRCTSLTESNLTCNYTNHKYWMRELSMYCKTKRKITTHEFVEKMSNLNTVRKTNSDLNKFSTWLKSRNRTRNIEDLSAPELDIHLATFIMTAVKNDGSKFEPETLKSIQTSLNRFFKQKEYLIDLIEGPQFSHSREVLASKRKLLRQQRKGNRSKQAEPLTLDEINIYEKNLLGKGNARALNSTMYMNNTMHFGMRTREEHADLRPGDVELKSTATGDRYLEFTERATKTRNGVVGGARAFPPKMYENKGNPRCPVSMYLCYSEKRPESMIKEDDPFYLGVNKKMTQGWYIAQPMGKNYLGARVMKMYEDAGIQGRKVNHSARKTAITTLIHAGVPPILVHQHSGHKNLASINNCSKASEKQQQAMSSIICNYSGTKTIESTLAATSVSAVDGDFGIPNDGDDDLLCRSSQEMVELIL
ncbi:hypothetical protein KUTeg_023901 [Tegillarca granosa]|uniref:Core-binding (CB) domain-containing protein n=1 Tax=Tegillarca granosa TaxID=220873 RepID=A0ABQ9E5H8_TEGGR|nr:hypothetical protein KUTeg_023901 [Tegillarca granosa]